MVRACARGGEGVEAGEGVLSPEEEFGVSSAVSAVGVGCKDSASGVASCCFGLLGEDGGSTGGEGEEERGICWGISVHCESTVFVEGSEEVVVVVGSEGATSCGLGVTSAPDPRGDGLGDWS